MEPPIPLGVYQHYKGGLYTVIGFVRHHGTGKPMVLYVSHEKGHTNCRPLDGWDGPDGVDCDGFRDEVYSDDLDSEATLHRFELVSRADVAPAYNWTKRDNSPVSELPAPSHGFEPNEWISAEYPDGLRRALDEAQARMSARFHSHQFVVACESNPTLRISDELLDALEKAETAATEAPWFWETKTSTIVAGLSAVCSLATSRTPKGKLGAVVHGQFLVLVRNTIGAMIRELRHHRETAMTPICAECNAKLAGDQCRDCGIVVP